MLDFTLATHINRDVTTTTVGRDGEGAEAAKKSAFHLIYGLAATASHRDATHYAIRTSNCNLLLSVSF